MSGRQGGKAKPLKAPKKNDKDLTEIFPIQFAAEEAGLNLRRWESCNKEVIEGIKKVSKKYDEKLEKAPFYVKMFKNSLRATYCAPGTEAYERLRTGKKKYLAAMWIKE
uniref:Translation machinery-associated protein 7 homolog n=1 Tax=Caenorhabditis japonica TaxID=281687 RepID=A0A8R1E539_CAEJA